MSGMHWQRVLQAVGFARRNVWALIRAVLFAAFGKAALHWLDTVGIHPDLWMLQLAGYAVTPSSLEAASWVLAIGAALAFATAWELTDFTRRMRGWLGLSSS
jgi:hypothetical protein